ncbi:MAG TPA: DUF3089 domain-containing protein [Gaiellales bacterium]|nr:DUF3089 domain-containing protein [Gaiellales bacterium]
MRGRLGTGGAVAAAILVACCLAVPAGAAAAKDDTVWLCKPGLADNPCKPGLTTTQISPTGEVLGTSQPKAKQPKVDCFYVYPTVSDDQSRNSDLSIDPEERSIALYQAARYSQRCRVFAPMYRQLTLATLFSGQPVTEAETALAYGDVVSAWKTYLHKYNKGRGIVLIGHSQGSFILRQLIADYIDKRPAVRKRLVGAYIYGGNVEVKEGKLVGGDFKHISGCEAPKQIGCIVGFSTFDAPVPADSKFGRVGGRLSTGDPATRDILCVNPAAPGGGPATLDTIFPSVPFAPGTTIGIGTQAVGIPQPDVSTTWIEAKGAYSGTCDSSDDADALEVSGLDGAPVLNAVPDATWGLHLVDANIALGDAVNLLKRQVKAYEKTAG